MKRLCSSFLILSISVLIGYHILSIWTGVHLYQTYPSKEGLLKAIGFEPRNPDPYYRLGLLHQLDLRHVDFEKSFLFLKKAIERNPLEQEYWLAAAKVLQQKGERTASDRALDRAIQIFPTGYRGRWVAGNLFLQRGDLEKALPHFSYILSHYPNQSSLVYDLFSKAVDSRDFILERLVPKDPVCLTGYLSYLYETGDEELVKKAWAKRKALGYKSNRTETLRHIDYLISRGNLSGAFQIWKEKLQEEGVSASPDGNLITNGGFEEEKVLGGGFDWRIEPVAGAEVSFDRSQVSKGKKSLKMVFNGKENLDFHHVYQYVPLKPQVDYLLKADLSTNGVTTKSGLKIEIIGVGSALYGASESLTGDNGWRELTIALHTPADVKGGIVRVRREKTDKFDRFLGGTAWLDNVHLTETR